MHANISPACRATGYCNIGCGYGAKLSTLDTVLPQAQQRYGLELMADVAGRADRARGRPRDAASSAATAERASASRSRPTRSSSRPARSARATCSSAAGSAATPSARDLHFNINSPLTADFPDEVDSFARHPDVGRLPVLGRRAALPGRDLVQPARHPGARHAGLVRPPLRQHAALPAHGVLGRAGRDDDAGPREGRRKHGPEIEYTASDDDQQALVEGLQVAGRIWFQAGAERVMPATFAWQEYRTPDALSELPATDPESGDLLMTSAHPQGGNALGAVVDEDFRVRGIGQPLPLRRERVPDQRAREPAADGDGHGPVRRAEDHHRPDGRRDRRGGDVRRLAGLVAGARRRAA